MKSKGIIPIALTALLWAIGTPDSLDEDAYHLFIVFLAVIVSLMIRVIPLAVSVLTGLAFAVLVRIFP